MTDHLRTRPATTPAMAALFCDAATLRHALDFEAALARAEAEEGLIPMAAAAEIVALCGSATFDAAQLADDAAFAGTLAIPLVKRLRAQLSPEAAAVLHKGATSQDVADTVSMRQARAASALLTADLTRTCRALACLAGRHAATPAVGRTLLQDALPIGFGLRLAQAMAGIEQAAERLDKEVAANARLQFGGAAGTRAGLEGRGTAVAARLADALGLAPALPWHGRREGVAAMGAALGIVLGALAKFARDVALLAQNAVGEAYEPRIEGRGGSSAMAHKRNPTGCQIALAAAMRAPGLVATILSALPAEQERGLGGWQAEGPVLAELFLLAGGSAAAMADVAEGLDVDEAAIARNLAAAGIGDDIGESEAITGVLLAHHRKD